jgi:phage-related holin
MAEQYLILIILVALVICLDVISGLIRSVATGIPITSAKGTKGFWKKMILLFSMAFAFFLDIALPTLLNVVKIQLPFERSLLFGSIVGVYIILNESISIAENIMKTNNKSLPKWLKKLLTGAKDEIDKKGEKNENKTE